MPSLRTGPRNYTERIRFISLRLFRPSTFFRFSLFVLARLAVETRKMYREMLDK